MAEEILMPKLGLTMTEGTVDLWHKKEGDTIQKGEVVCEISSEKLSQEVEAETDGILIKIIVPVDEEVPCKTVLGLIGQTEEINTTPHKSSKIEDNPVELSTILPEKTEEITNNSRIFISPAARRLAGRLGIDYTLVSGTGGNGRITKRDIITYQPYNETTNNMIQPTAAPVGEGLVGMRKVIAKNMMHSLTSSAQVTLHRKANITQLMTFRETLRTQLGDTVDKHIFSLNVLVLKALSQALKDVPQMNASYDGQNYHQWTDINIGIAVALDEGLIVPVIHHIDRLSLQNISSQFTQLISSAKSGQLASKDLQAGTFSMTNLGREGIEYFTPILNTPQVGILGVGAMSSRLAFNHIREITEIIELPLSLTFDHQVIDGAPASQFMKQLVYYLENPYLLII